jgi:hypothetical protein
MNIAIVMSAWTLGSIFLGLVLGGLFKVFAGRRLIDEEFFAWVEKMDSSSEASPAPSAGGLRDCDVFLQPL